MASTSVMIDRMYELLSVAQNIEESQLTPSYIVYPTYYILFTSSHWRLVIKR